MTPEEYKRSGERMKRAEEIKSHIEAIEARRRDWEKNVEFCFFGYIVAKDIPLEDKQEIRLHIMRQESARLEALRREFEAL